MTGADPVFVDTNVLIYVSRPSALQHRSARAALSALDAAGCRLWISRQVLREYAAVVTRPQATAPGLSMADAIADIRRFEALFEVVEDSRSIFERWMALLSTYGGAGKQVHDTHLVAAMLEAGARRLLTFNQADFRRFAPLIAIEAVLAA